MWSWNKFLGGEKMRHVELELWWKLKIICCVGFEMVFGVFGKSSQIMWSEGWNVWKKFWNQFSLKFVLWTSHWCLSFVRGIQDLPCFVPLFWTPLLDTPFGHPSFDTPFLTPSVYRYSFFLKKKRTLLMLKKNLTVSMVLSDLQRVFIKNLAHPFDNFKVGYSKLL